MLVQYSALVLASQLWIAAADNVPQFNIERGCKDTTTANGPKTQLDEMVCVQDEQNALDRLRSLWSQIAPSDRAMCMREATNLPDLTPSYVELLDCLQEQQLVRRLGY
jgi:hypothetical protein